MSSFVRALKGEEKLWKVFWVWGFVIAPIVEFILLAQLGFKRIDVSTTEVMTLLLAVTWSISVWRCAVNCTSLRWRKAARIYVGAIWAVPVFSYAPLNNFLKMNGACNQLFQQRAQAENMSYNDYIKIHDTELSGCKNRAWSTGVVQ